jgi:transposase
VAYPAQFRKKLLSVKEEEGLTNEEAAKRFGVRLVTVALFALNVDTDIFYAWLTQDLLPKISAGTVIVMDNASFHKRTDITQAIEFKGCILEFLPTYSPDLNPREHTWAQLKSIRHYIRCAVDVLFSESVVGHLFMPL